MHRVALLALVVGCGAGGDTTIDRTFDPCTLAVAATVDAGQRAGLDDALGLWQLAPGDGDPVALVFEDAAEAFHGLYDDETGTVIINRRITNPRVLAIVIAHELGHAFGLPHVDDRPSLMNRGNLSVAPTTADFAAVSALWGPCAARPRS